MTYHIERFYDKQYKIWVALLMDEGGNQVADAEYAPSRMAVYRIKESDFNVYNHLTESHQGKYLTEAVGFTFQELAANSSKVLAASDYKASPSNYRFEHIKMNIMTRLKYVSYDTTTWSLDSGKHYKTSIFFYNVAEGQKPDLNKSVVRVSCSCRAYYFYASYWNKVHGAHARRPLKAYVRKTTDLPERNPMHIPCLCKHLIAFGDFLSVQNYQYPATAPAKLQKPFSTDDKEKRFGYSQKLFNQKSTNMPGSKPDADSENS